MSLAGCAYMPAGIAIVYPVAGGTAAHDICYDARSHFIPAAAQHCIQAGQAHVALVGGHLGRQLLLWCEDLDIGSRSLIDYKWLAAGVEERCDVRQLPGIPGFILALVITIHKVYRRGCIVVAGSHIIPYSGVIVAGQGIDPPQYPGAGGSLYRIVDVHIQRTAVALQVGLYTGVFIDGLFVFIVYEKLPCSRTQPFPAGGVCRYFCPEGSAPCIQCIKGQRLGAVIDQYYSALLMARFIKSPGRAGAGAEENAYSRG